MNTENENNMNWISELTDDVIERFNKEGARCAVVVIRPDGSLITKKTDNFRTVAEYLGIWDAAKFQDAIALWKLQSVVSDRSSGVELNQ